MLGETVGSINITASGYLITRSRAMQESGSTTTVTEYPETVITHVHLISGSSASVLTVQNGQGGNTFISLKGTSNQGQDFDFGVFGIVLNSGAYVTVDNNIVSATFTCKANKA